MPTFIVHKLDRHAITFWPVSITTQKRNWDIFLCQWCWMESTEWVRQRGYSVGPFAGFYGRLKAILKEGGMSCRWPNIYVSTRLISKHSCTEFSKQDNIINIDKWNSGGVKKLCVCWQSPIGRKLICCRVDWWDFSLIAEMGACSKIVFIFTR